MIRAASLSVQYRELRRIQSAGTPSVRLLRHPASRHRHALRQYATNQDVNASRQYSKIRVLSLLSGFSI
jgi:hypothetical protein